MSEGYVLDHVSKNPNEIVRLDLIHDALKAYNRGKLMGVPQALESNPPKSILEMGAGSGAWAADAATTFPESEVLAVDIAEIPRALPHNVTFLAADLTKPFDFKPDRFDLVHGRLLFINLPNFKNVLERTIPLVKPGGWLIIEEALLVMWESDLDDGLDPLLSAWLTAWDKIMEARDSDLRAPIKLESLLRQSGVFSEINVNKLALPISEQTDDPIFNELGAAVRYSFNSVFVDIPRRVPGPNFTESMGREALKVVNDRSKKLRVNFYCISARKCL